ncbi:DNA primase [uncultured virus]|nr:DNA primase [uncultured virus]
MKLISKELPGGSRMYTAFNNYADLYQYMTRVEKGKRNFHEVIMEYVHQKPRFDIDISTKDINDIPDKYCGDLHAFGRDILEMVIQSSIDVLKVDQIHLDIEKDFMIFSSHNAKKASYHIILNRYKHANCHEAAAFYQKCCDVATDPLLFGRFVDPGVYKKNGNLRLVWACKPEDPTRIKEYNQSFIFRGQTITHQIDEIEELGSSLQSINSQREKELIIISNSLITFVADCTLLPIYQSTTQKQYEEINLSEECIQNAHQEYSQWAKDCGERAFPIASVKSGLIQLKRDEPSYCQECLRVHDHVSPFLYFSGADLYYHCARLARGKRGRQVGYVSMRMAEIVADQSDVVSDLRARGLIKEKSSLDWEIINRIMDQHGTVHRIPHKPIQPLTNTPEFTFRKAEMIGKPLNRSQPIPVTKRDYFHDYHLSKSQPTISSIITDGQHADNLWADEQIFNPDDEGNITPSSQEVNIIPSTQEVKTPSTQEVNIIPSTQEVKTPSSQEVKTPSTQEVNILPSTQEVNIIPSSQEVNIIPSSQEVNIIPSTQEVNIIPSTQEVKTPSTSKNLAGYSTTTMLHYDLKKINTNPKKLIRSSKQPPIVNNLPPPKPVVNSSPKHNVVSLRRLKIPSQ